MSGSSPPHTRRGTCYSRNMDAEIKAVSDRVDKIQLEYVELNNLVKGLNENLTEVLAELQESKLKSDTSLNNPNENGSEDLSKPGTDLAAGGSGAISSSLSQSASVNKSSFFEHKLLKRRDIDANFLAFSKQNPGTWFKVTEERFDYLGITSDEDKFWVTLKCIGPSLFDELEAFLPSLRPDSKYPILKAEILRKLAQSEDDQLDRLLRQSSMGKRTPSEYFNVVQSLSSGIMNQDAALRFWWKGLPTDIAISVDPEIHKLDTSAAVEKANRIAELKRRSELQSFNASVSSVESSLASRDINHSEIVDRIGRIEAFVRNESRSREISSNNRKRRISRKRSTSENSNKTSDWLCFYHHNFGEKAKYCAKGCTWKAKSNGALQDKKPALPLAPPSKNE